MADRALSAVGLNHDEAAFAAFTALAVRQSTTLVALCDAQLRPIYLNAVGRDMVGLSADANITGYDFLDFFTREHRVVVEAVAIPTLLREGRWDGELSFRHFADPSCETEVRWSAFTIKDTAGKMTGAVMFTTDITTRKQAERALRYQQALLASLLENLPLGVGVYDRRGSLSLSNERLRDYLGLSRLPSLEPASSRRWHGYDADNQPIPPEDYPGARALGGEWVMPGIDFLYEAEGGPERWMRISAVPFRREDEEADEAIVVVQDIDDLKRAAERIETAAAVLASQSRFLEATLSSIPDFVYAFDRERRFAYANAAMLGLFGLTASEMLGRDFADLGYPADLADHLNGHIDHILAEGVTIEDEVFFSSPTGRSAYFEFVWARSGPTMARSNSSSAYRVTPANDAHLKKRSARARPACGPQAIWSVSASIRGIRSQAHSTGMSDCAPCGDCPPMPL